MSKVDAEHGELLLYQNMVLREAGRTSKALEHLIEFASLMHDKLVVREIKGIILQVLVTLIRVIPKQMLGADNNLCPGLPLRYVNAESLPGKDPITDNMILPLIQMLGFEVPVKMTNRGMTDEEKLGRGYSTFNWSTFVLNNERDYETVYQVPLLSVLPKGVILQEH